MQRDPIETAKKKYIDLTQPKKLYPVFRYRRCECCGNEFILEPVWKITNPHFDKTWTYKARFGCTNCFPTGKDFRDYLIDRGYLEKEGMAL